MTVPREPNLVRSTVVLPERAPPASAPAPPDPPPAAPPPAGRIERLGRVSERITLGLMLLLPGAFTLVLSFVTGGYGVGTTALVAIEAAALLAARVLLARRPLEGVSTWLVVASAALAAFAVWTLASEAWSDSPSRAQIEYTRVLAYLLPLIAFGTIARTAGRVRLAVYGVAGAIVCVCIAALAARMLPEAFPVDPGYEPNRLSFPLSYWNALGIMAGIGIVLCGHITSSLRDPRVARVLAAAAIPLLVATQYYTFSRGATWAAVVAVVAYVLIGRPRGLISAAISTLPPAVAVFAVVNPANRLTDDPLSAAAIALGHETALAILGCALAAAVLRTLCLALDARVARIKFSVRSRRILLGTAAAVVTIAVGAAAVVFDAASVVSEKYDEFNASAQTDRGGSSSNRLLQTSSNGRKEHWDAALVAYRRDKLHGTGAGTYAVTWFEERDSTVHVLNAHSLYLEVLSELGWPGLALVVIALLAILVGCLSRARGPDRALYAAVAAAIIAWALHAGLDWDWELPAITLWLFALGGLCIARAPHEPRRELPGRNVLVPVGRALAVAACIAIALLPTRIATSQTKLDAAIEAVDRGDCRAARAQIAASLDAVGTRPEPRQNLAWCVRQEGGAAPAAEVLRAALAHDPRNWELHYNLAAARASQGLDPRKEAALAHRLNPQDALTVEAVRAFRGDEPDRWRRAGRRMPFLLPSS
jgi:hypothetical protein